MEDKKVIFSGMQPSGSLTLWQLFRSIEELGKFAK